VVAECFHYRSDAPPALELVGRGEQLSRLTAAISDTPRGRTVVVSGAAGSGKSALLEVACRHARSVGLRVLSIAGTPGESDTPFAGVHQLIHALGRWGDEAAQYQRIIDGTLRSPSGEQLDTVRVAIALIGILAAVEKRQSVLVCIDDGQWLDAPSRNAMMFAARRSAGRLLTVVLAIPATAGKVFSGDGRSVEIELPPLERDDAAVLLDRQPSVPRGLRREQVLTAAAGNPAAVIAFAETAAADDCTVGPAAEPMALPAPSLGIYSRRLALLPGATRAALLVLAAASDQDLRHVMPAVLADAQTLAPAEVAGIVRVESSGVHFLDPLIRSAAYHRAPSAARSAAHLRLAEALVALPHRQVWHRAQAALKPDDALAAQLADTCDEVLRRDGYLAAATVMQRAAMLTSDVGEHARRLVRAAPLARNAGDPNWAAVMSRRALNGVDDLVHQVRAHTELGSARCWDANNQPVLDILLKAAGLAVDIAPAVAWESLRVAATITFIADDSAGRCGVARLLRQLEDAEPPTEVAALVDRIWIRTATDLHLAHLQLPNIIGLASRVRDSVGLTAVGASAWLAGEPDLAVRCLRGAHAAALAPRFGGLTACARSAGAAGGCAPA
jgi:hypothetical protein